MSTRRHLGLGFVAALAAACTGDIFEEHGPAPTVLAMSANAVSVGQSVEFVGTDFIAGKDGHTEIRLEGTYTTEDGDQHQVDLMVRPLVKNPTRLIWSHVGPFAVPFTPKGNELGDFEGIATPINISKAREQSPGDSIPVRFSVGPSIIIRDLQPLGATCEEPAKRLLAGFPYRIEVEAVGFQPVSFTYQILDERELPIVHRQPTTSPRASFGDKGELFLAPVAASDVFYFAELQITATDAQGESISSLYRFGVHRPVEYVDWGVTRIAEIEAPQPITGCIAGGLNGQHTEYRETKSETRERQVSYHWDRTWVTEHSTNYSTSHEERNGVNMSSTVMNEQSWEVNWNNTLSGSVTLNVGYTPSVATGGLNGGAAVEIGGSLSRGGANRGSTSESSTVGHDFSEADTESWAYTTSESDSVAKGTGEFMSISSTESIDQSGSTEIIPGMYGVWYRQVTKYVRPGSVIVYNLCGDPQVAADALFEDYRWAASLGQGSTCDPLPKTNLPEPRCYDNCN